MKNTTFLYGALIAITLFFISCSNDEENGNNENEITNKQLISMTQQQYTNNVLNATLTYRFNDQKLTSVQYSDNRYDEIYYDGDLVSKIIEFDSNNNLEWLTAYSYDSAGRLTAKEVSPGPNNAIQISRRKDFVYGDDIIQSTIVWSDGGFHKNIITQNNNNQIIEDKSLTDTDLIVLRRYFEYQNNNLTKQTIKHAETDITSFEATYNYLDKVTCESYKYSKMLFGNQWKTNSSLNKQFGLGQFHSYEISENYISDYYFVNMNNVSTTGTFEYEFDTNENITKQTFIENTSTSAFTYKTITTYEYE